MRIQNIGRNHIFKQYNNQNNIEKRTRNNTKDVVSFSSIAPEMVYNMNKETLTLFEKASSHFYTKRNSAFEKITAKLQKLSKTNKIEPNMSIKSHYSNITSFDYSLKGKTKVDGLNVSLDSHQTSILYGGAYYSPYQSLSLMNKDKIQTRIFLCEDPSNHAKIFLFGEKIANDDVETNNKIQQYLKTILAE